METFFSKSELINKAKELGAKSFVQKIIPNQFGNKVYNSNIFSTHFLNGEGLEIAYFIDSDYKYQKDGLKENNNPKEINTSLKLTEKFYLV